jgi:leader peptidase (prepilin peptidase)/N-methyltransferase
MPILPLALFWFFVLGLAIGSFLNVCVGRLPYEKSLLWPSSRCPVCYQPIQLRDNIPLLGFLLLRGRCRSCGCPISWRYPRIELLTGLAFVGLYYLEMVANVLDLPILFNVAWMPPGMVPLPALTLYVHHGVLLGFLIVVSLCDLEDMEIPLSITVTGTVVGLVLSTLLPWPYPNPAPLVPMVRAGVFPGPVPFPPNSGAQLWPVWYPLPDWLPAGSWQLGLLTGLAGALAGMLMLRGVRFLFGLGRGIEGLGVGDADLMMMAGAFLGWQAVVLAFFVSVFPALIFAAVQVLRGGGQALPFGPSLALGVIITMLCWPRIGPHFQEILFKPEILGVLGIGGALIMVVMAFIFRVFAWLMKH